MGIRYRGRPGSNLTPIWILLAINLLFYFASTIQEGVVFSTFGLSQRLFADQPWTIVTNMFVHASLWHIMGNMLMLYFFGSYVLRLLGESKFLFIYFAAGLLGNVTFLLLGPEYAIAVGASGALYGVMGTLAVMRPRLKVLLYFLIPIDLWIVVVLGAVMISPGIAWQAHLGGLLLGVAAGLYFRKRERGAYFR